MARFVLSDESVNRYGYRVLTSGIDLTAFKKSPVMLYMHNRNLLPIGKWEDIRKESDGTLTAEAVFDKEDEFAQSIESKVEQGILNACSIGFSVIALSDDPKVMAQGQTRPTITKAEIFECSIVDIPGNRNAMKLKFENQGLQLSGDMQPEFLNSVLPIVKIKINMNKIIAALALMAAGLDSTLTLAVDATEDQVAEFVGKLSAKLKTSQAELMLKMGESAGLITEQNKGKFQRLAAVDAGLAMEFLSEEKPAATTEAPKEKELRLADVLKETQKLNAGSSTTTIDPRASWTMRDWEKKDSKGLLKMKREDNARYLELFNAEYKTV